MCFTSKKIWREVREEGGAIDFHPVFSPYALKGPFPTLMQGARLFFSLEPLLLFK